MPAHDITTSYYLEPGVMTAPGAYGPLLAGLPPGIAAVAEAAHGLLIHEHIAGPYGVTLTQEDRASVHIRPVAGLLERLAWMRHPAQSFVQGATTSTYLARPGQCRRTSRCPISAGNRDWRAPCWGAWRKR
jgi:hypothetical protein